MSMNSYFIVLVSPCSEEQTLISNCTWFCGQNLSKNIYEFIFYLLVSPYSEEWTLISNCFQELIIHKMWF